MAAQHHLLACSRAGDVVIWEHVANAEDEDAADVFGEVHMNNQATQAVTSWVSLRPKFPEIYSNILNSHDSQIPGRLASEW